MTKTADVSKIKKNPSLARKTLILDPRQGIAITVSIFFSLNS